MKYEHLHRGYPLKYAHVSVGNKQRFENELFEMGWQFFAEEWSESIHFVGTSSVLGMGK